MFFSKGSPQKRTGAVPLRVELEKGDPQTNTHTFDLLVHLNIVPPQWKFTAFGGTGERFEWPKKGGRILGKRLPFSHRLNSHPKATK